MSYIFHLIYSFLYLLEDEDDKLKNKESHLTHFPPTSAMVGITSALGLSYLVDIYFPVTCSVGFYRVWVIGEIKFGAVQVVQACNRICSLVGTVRTEN